MNKSILPPEMRGVMKVSGYRGVGKTFLCAQADAPENVAFFDFESKGEGVHGQLHFGLYQALTQQAGGPNELYDVVTKAFHDLEQDRFTVAVIDNTAPLELALQAGARRKVVEYCQEYGLNIKNVRAGRFGGLKSVVNFLIGDQVCSILHGRGVQLIITTSHIKPRWGGGGPIPNKYRVKGADRWQELSILSLILVPGEFAPVPAAIVEKEQLGLLSWNPETMEHEAKRRLPQRIARCTFAEIRRYLKEPADLSNPAPGEVSTEEESDPFDERLSKEQIAIMKLALEQEQRQNREEVEEAFSSPKVEKPNPILELAKAGKSAAEIAAELGKPLPVVRRVLAG